MSSDLPVPRKRQSVTVFGRRLSPGSVLTEQERQALLQLQERRPNAEVKAILEASPGCGDLQPIPAQEAEDVADEATIRAREALIALGEFPGEHYELAIRSGQMDHLSAVQAAIRVLLDREVPLNVLARLSHSSTSTELTVVERPTRNSFWTRFREWVESLQHRYVRLMSRYEATKADNQKLRRLIAELEGRGNRRNRFIRQTLDELEKTKERLRDQQARTLHLRAREARERKRAGGVEQPLLDHANKTSFTEIYRLARTAEERAALCELIKHGIAARVQEPSGDVRLSVRLSSQRTK